MVEASDAVTLILVGVAALCLPPAARRIRLPPVVLEILFGVLVGPVLHIASSSSLLESLARLGFLMLMLLTGFEINIGFFQRQGSGPIVVGLLGFGATLSASWVASQVLDTDPFMVMVLATTSVGLVVPSLRSAGVASRPIGQDILLGALLADFLTLLGVTVIAVLAGGEAGWRLLGIPGFFVIVAAVLLGIRRAAWWHPDRFGALFAADDTEEMGIRATLALLFVFVGVASLLGIESVLAAFLAGGIIALVFRERGALDRKLSGFSYGFLIPIFFIDVGIRFDLTAVTDVDALVFTGKLLIAAFAVKTASALVLVLRGHGLRSIAAAAALLSARLSLIIVVAEIGRHLGFISTSQEGSIILLAIVTTTVAPTLFRRLLPASAGGEPEGASAGG
ncbi:MAG: cation:proton antiporter [Acidimicrobiia bacterium]|nr:cation:proton antiporter [bacterium]MXX02105.1 cation:proton antiporter [Acidimicrobiia bacterium]MDE0675590.1 cation:proton antiporter [bacterium]MXX45743.1 cation:proton antiporter [Acidimicrobiia bacterium]MXY75107.1 cation:proton antiporter [Acidimicrobiia bacterium]